MPIIGAFLGSPDFSLAAGTFAVSLKGQTTDRQNMNTMSWTVTCTTGAFNSWLPGDASATNASSRTVAADQDGAAVITLEAGKRYRFQLNHSGYYQNDRDLYVTGESKQMFGLLWDLFSYPEVNTQLDVEAEGSSVTITSGSNTMTATVSNNIATFSGLPTGSTWTVTDGLGTGTVTIEHLYQRISIIKPKVYGFRVALSTSNSSSAVTYTDDAVGITPASGHNLNGWAGKDIVKNIKPVVLRNNGASKEYLNLRDLTKTISGAASNIATAGNDAMTEIPTVYVKITADSSYIFVKLSTVQIDPSYEAWAHLQDGKVQEYIYIGDFDGYVSGSKLYSKSGSAPTVNTSITNFITYAKARGTGFDIFRWKQLSLVKMLFILFYKTLDSQTALGKGYVGGSAAQTCNPISFDNDYGLAGSTSTTTRMSFLWIHDLWGNVYQFVGGAKTNANRQLMIIEDGYSSVDDGDFSVVADTPSLSSNLSGYISAVNTGSKSLFFPKATSGSSTTYWCDGGNVYASYFPNVGGYWHDGDYAGLFNAYFYYSATDTNSYIGSRLSYCLAVA